MIEAAELREFDRDYHDHKIAYLTVAAGATKGKRGRPVYRDFNDFFNYEKELKRVTGKTTGGKFDRLSHHLRERNGREDGG